MGPSTKCDGCGWPHEDVEDTIGYLGTCPHGHVVCENCRSEYGTCLLCAVGATGVGREMLRHYVSNRGKEAN